MHPILILGYGNPDREDDGAAWHVLQALALYFDRPVTTVDDLETDGLSQSDQPAAGRHHEKSPPYPLTVSPHLAFTLQLTPEIAEILTRYDYICFVDVHTGRYPEEIRVAPLTPGYQASPFTHHLTPESCLALAETLYGRAPTGLMVSIRGYRFGYGTELSGQTANLVHAAAEQIINWVTQIE